MKTHNYTFRILVVLASVFCTLGEALAQGPPPPPPPSGAPLDGGLIAFLIVALFGGSKFLSKNK